MCIRDRHYTNRQINSFKDGGSLKIKAISESFTDQGLTKKYTSARLNSKFAFKYGRLEVRAKLPSIAGAWPAIWLLGKNINENGGYWDNQGFGTTSWPSSGETVSYTHLDVYKRQPLFRFSILHSNRCVVLLNLLNLNVVFLICFHLSHA